jgi:predicted ArsR family transcriptional regulator
MDLERHAVGIGTLADPTRRALYTYVVSCRDAVGREEAASAIGVSVSTAGFHLEKMAAEGLLDTELRRLTGRSGPGAGRPSKLYRRGRAEFTVTLPPRRYDVVGEILSTAFERVAQGGDADQSLTAAAVGQGRDLGAAAREAGATGDVQGLVEVLTGQGYDARPADAAARPEVVELANCPFDTLARRHVDLVCGLNQHFVQGVADGLGCHGARARLAPSEGMCCVRVEVADDAG